MPYGDFLASFYMHALAAGEAVKPALKTLLDAERPSSAGIAQLYQMGFGRAADAAGLAEWTAQVAATGEKWSALFKDFAKGGVANGEAVAPWLRTLGGLETGGWVGNGVWNHDSVLAAYAGGGNIALAGGEYVVNARAAARYADVLPAINAGRFSGANDNGTADLLAELRALRAEVAELRKTTAQGAMAVQGEVAQGNRLAARSATADRLKVGKA